MTLANALREARMVSSVMGHRIDHFAKDTNLSAVAECKDCGALAAVDVSGVGDQLEGRALHVLCQAVPPLIPGRLDG